MRLFVQNRARTSSQDASDAVSVFSLLTVLYQEPLLSVSFWMSPRITGGWGGHCGFGWLTVLLLGQTVFFFSGVMTLN